MPPGPPGKTEDRPATGQNDTNTPPPRSEQWYFFRGFPVPPLVQPAVGGQQGAHWQAGNGQGTNGQVPNGQVNYGQYFYGQNVQVNYGCAANGHPINGHGTNVLAANVLAANALAANGLATNRLATNGHATNGYATNGHAINGHSMNGHAINGFATNGLATNMHAMNGLAANGLASNGHPTNRLATNSLAMNGQYANGQYPGMMPIQRHNPTHPAYETGNSASMQLGSQTPTNNLQQRCSQPPSSVPNRPANGVNLNGGITSSAPQQRPYPPAHVVLGAPPPKSTSKKARANAAFQAPKLEQSPQLSTVLSNGHAATQDSNDFDEQTYPPHPKRQSISEKSGRKTDQPSFGALPSASPILDRASPQQAQSQTSALEVPNRVHLSTPPERQLDEETTELDEPPQHPSGTNRARHKPRRHLGKNHCSGSLPPRPCRNPYPPPTAHKGPRAGQFVRTASSARLHSPLPPIRNRSHCPHLQGFEPDAPEVQEPVPPGSLCQFDQRDFAPEQWQAALNRTTHKDRNDPLHGGDVRHCTNEEAHADSGDADLVCHGCRVAGTFNLDATSPVLSEPIYWPLCTLCARKALDNKERVFQCQCGHKWLCPPCFKREMEIRLVKAEADFDVKANVGGGVDCACGAEIVDPGVGGLGLKICGACNGLVMGEWNEREWERIKGTIAKVKAGGVVDT